MPPLPYWCPLYAAWVPFPWNRWSVPSPHRFPFGKVFWWSGHRSVDSAQPWWSVLPGPITFLCEGKSEVKCFHQSSLVKTAFINCKAHASVRLYYFLFARSFRSFSKHPIHVAYRWGWHKHSLQRLQCTGPGRSQGSAKNAVHRMLQLMFCLLKKEKINSVRLATLE